jgi:hypothetical protein
MAQSLTIVIVDKTGTIKALNVKDYKEEELFKKCGFKKAEGFTKHTDWSVKIDGKKYSVAMYGKIDGKAGMENKYDFPPPIDTKLFFGACALVATSIEVTKAKTLCNLSLDLWNKIYEKLFGGFENLALTVVEDEEEEDELAAIPASKKTKKGGYLKDGFVVDTESSSEHSGSDSSGSDDESELNDSEETTDKEEGIVLEEIGSELSEEAYDYSSEDEDKDKDKDKDTKKKAK